MKTRNSHGLLQLIGREALAYCQCASALISGNKALFVSVDLIGEKNQIILEYEMETIQINKWPDLPHHVQLVGVTPASKENINFYDIQIISSMKFLYSSIV